VTRQEASHTAAPRTVGTSGFGDSGWAGVERKAGSDAAAARTKARVSVCVRVVAAAARAPVRAHRLALPKPLPQLQAPRTGACARTNRDGVCLRRPSVQAGLGSAAEPPEARVRARTHPIPTRTDSGPKGQQSWHAS
jgi:hypothetical protein